MRLKSGGESAMWKAMRLLLAGAISLGAFAWVLNADEDEVSRDEITHMPGARS